jgi:hypothetical protein
MSGVGNPPNGGRPGRPGTLPATTTTPYDATGAAPQHTSVRTPANQAAGGMPGLMGNALRRGLRNVPGAARKVAQLVGDAQRQPMQATMQQVGMAADQLAQSAQRNFQRAEQRTQEQMQALRDSMPSLHAHLQNCNNHVVNLHMHQNQFGNVSPEAFAQANQAAVSAQNAVNSAQIELDLYQTIHNIAGSAARNLPAATQAAGAAMSHLSTNLSQMNIGQRPPLLAPPVPAAPGPGQFVPVPQPLNDAAATPAAAPHTPSSQPGSTLPSAPNFAATVNGAVNYMQHVSEITDQATKRFNAIQDASAARYDQMLTGGRASSAGAAAAIAPQQAAAPTEAQKQQACEAATHNISSRANQKARDVIFQKFGLNPPDSAKDEFTLLADSTYNDLINNGRYEALYNTELARIAPQIASEATPQTEQPVAFAPSAPTLPPIEQEAMHVAKATIESMSQVAYDEELAKTGDTAAAQVMQQSKLHSLQIDGTYERLKAEELQKLSTSGQPGPSGV